MRTRLPLRALGVVLLAACGGSPRTGGGSPADPQDVASVRLFNSGLGELTFHIPLFPGDTLPVEVRTSAASGTPGTLEVALHFPADQSTKTFGPFDVLVH